MPKFRLAPLSNDDLTVEVWKWKRFLIFPIKGWVRFSTIRSRVNKKEWEIIEHIKKIEKLLSDRKLLVENYLSELDEAQDRARTNYGLSEPQFLNDKDFDEVIGPYNDRPSDEWVEFFNPRIIREYALKAGRKQSHYETSYRNVDAVPQRQRAGTGAGHVTMPGHTGAVTGYTFHEFADKSIHIGEQTGVSQVVGYREDQNKGNPANAKARLKELRAENPRATGESEGAYNNRMQGLLKEEQNPSKDY